MVGILMAHVGREFAGSRAFLPHVCRRGVPPVHMRGEFAGRPRTGARRVPRGRPPVLVWPEFRATVQTRGRSVPGCSVARTREGRVCGPPANSRQKCTGPGAARTCLARVCASPANSRQKCTGTGCREPHLPSLPAQHARVPLEAPSRLPLRPANEWRPPDSCKDVSIRAPELAVRPQLLESTSLNRT